MAPIDPNVVRGAVTTLLALILACTVGCQGTGGAQKLPDPNTIDTSTTAGLIKKLQAQNSTPAENENLRYIGFLIADYGTSMTSQVVNTILTSPDLTMKQRIWLQEIRIDMGRALIGCAANPTPAANVFQELFIFKIAYLIAKRDAPGVLGQKADVLVDKLKSIQELIWEKVRQGVEAPLDPLDKDVAAWMKEYGADTHRFWWPREVGLLMSLDSVDNLKFTGMFASVERANEGIDQLNKTFETTQFLLERLPMLASWEVQLATAKMLADPVLSGFIDSFSAISKRLTKLESAVETNFVRLADALDGFGSAIDRSLPALGKELTDLGGMLDQTRDRLSSSLLALEDQIDDQNQQLVRQLSVTSSEIGTSTTDLARSLERLDSTIVDQEARIESIANDMQSELAGQAGQVLDRVTLRIGLAVGLGVLAALLVAGLLGLLVLRTGLLGRGNSQSLSQP